LNDDAVLQLVDNTTKEQEATDNAPPVLQAWTFLELTQDKIMDDNSEEFDDEPIGISVSGWGECRREGCCC
jgi:hypothetical protein